MADTLRFPPLPTPGARLRLLWIQVRPALLTFSFVVLMLGLFLSTMILLIAWIRTPEALFVSTDPGLPRVVRGGESFHAIQGWLGTELVPGLAMVLAGWAGILALGDRDSDRLR